jgi:hypothetical protein
MGVRRARAASWRRRTRGTVHGGELHSLELLHGASSKTIDEEKMVGGNGQKRGMVGIGGDGGGRA